jgi:hypothetical protein
MYETFSMDIWCDFPVSCLDRALFAIPLMRNGAVAYDGTRVVSEKSLTSYLSLRERVVYRRRVMLISNAQRGIVLYPTWDFNGPDLSYFGEWKPSLECPWNIDGRKLVADAKDRVLQMVEAAKAKGLKRLLVYEGVPHTLTLKRGWHLGSMPWLAFYAGVRKAAEVADMDIVAVCENNPYEGITSPVSWAKDVEPRDGDVACFPCDTFSAFNYDPLLVSVLKDLLVDAPSISTLFAWMPMVSHASTLHLQHRNAHWNP